MTKQLNLQHYLDVYFAYQQIIVWSLVGLMAVLVGMYIYLVSVSISNIAVREEGQTQISLLENDISSLEAEYMVLSTNITLAKALERGFVEVAGGGVFVASQERPMVSFRN
ncbi:MAG: hypothetical protein HYV76_00350 [Candidatus Vogelbacteria bacterium]|nr:hypothetical protein [Candidatus Vogelbacteria bacterium]